MNVKVLLYNMLATAHNKVLQFWKSPWKLDLSDPEVTYSVRNISHKLKMESLRCVLFSLSSVSSLTTRLDWERKHKAVSKFKVQSYLSGRVVDLISEMYGIASVLLAVSHLCVGRGGLKTPRPWSLAFLLSLSARFCRPFLKKNWELKVWLSWGCIFQALQSFHLSWGYVNNVYRPEIESVTLRESVTGA